MRDLLVMSRLVNKATVIAALAGAAITGCGANSGAGGKLGAPVEPATLTLADANYGVATPAVLDFVRDLDHDSHGALEIKLVDTPQAGDYEVRIVHGIATGRWNLAWVGARVLDEVGVPDAGALQVPFLIDSYALEAAVVNGPIGEQLTREISHAGVVGIGLLTDQLRYFATTGPVTSPASLVGRRMRAFDSASQFTGWRALRATSVLVNSARTATAITLMHEGRLFGVESDPWAYSQQSAIAGTTYTVGMPIWPRAVAIIAAPGWFASLPDATRSLLRLAARQASAQSLADAPGVDAAGIKSMCAGVHVHVLNPAQRAAFIATGKAVAAELARTEPYGALIRAIERLKGSSAPQPAPPIPVGCDVASPTAALGGARASRAARELAYALRPGTVYRAMIGFAIINQQLGLQQADVNAGTFTWHFSSGNRFLFTEKPLLPALSGPNGPPATGTFKIHGDLLDVTFNQPYPGYEVDRCSVSGTSVTCYWLSGNDGWTTKFDIGGMTTPLTLVRG